MEIKKQLMQLGMELGEALTTYDFNLAYQIAGKLNSMLKSDEVQKLPRKDIELLQYKLRDYYKFNEEVSQAQRRLVALGHSLKEVTV